VASMASGYVKSSITVYICPYMYIYIRIHSSKCISIHDDNTLKSDSISIHGVGSH